MWSPKAFRTPFIINLQYEDWAQIIVSRNNLHNKVGVQQPIYFDQNTIILHMRIIDMKHNVVLEG